MFAKSLLLVMPLALAAFQAQAADGCMRATRALVVGAVPSAQDLVAADCGNAKPAPAVRYDAAMRTVRLTRALQADDIVAFVPAAMMASITPGQKLYVSVQVSPVIVQREVEALQPANPGQKLFVRAADGKVFSVLYTGDAQ